MQTRDVSLTISKFSKSATLICEICNPNTTIAGFISRAIKKDGNNCLMQ
jgi:hypothetical protein